jgi:hypothetical protein
MADSRSATISLGRWDPYRRTPSILLLDGKLKFIPGPGTHGEFEVKEVKFPAGARLEYRIQNGDMFFDGDHSQPLGRTLWAVEPDGNKILMATGFVLYISPIVASRNLKERGIPFRVVSFYEGKDGQVVEREISIPQSGARITARVLLGFSNLWLGALAGAFVHNTTQIIAIGSCAFAILAIIRLRSAASKRVASVAVGLGLVSYAAGYSVSALVARSILSGFTGR